MASDPWEISTIALAGTVFWMPWWFWMILRGERTRWKIEQTAREITQARQAMEAEAAELRRELTDG